jgi:hypothetical protein
MIARAIRLAAYFVPLPALGLAIALAGPATAGESLRFASLCPSDSGLAQRVTLRPLEQDRLALHCKCCGWDENKHCNHQCCTDE